MRGALFLVLAASVALAQTPAEKKPLDFRQTLSSPTVGLGEPFTLTLTFTHPSTERYELSAPPKDLPLELLGQSRQRKDGQKETTTTFILQLAAFELGTQALPAWHFEVSDAEGTGTFSAPPLSVEVKAQLPEEGEELKDLKGPLEIAVPSWRLLWALAALAGLGVLIFLAVKFLKRRVRLPPAPIRALPLEQRTREALDALRKENLPQQGRGREFFFRLSEILRRYLGERYRFEALECTSSELLRSLEQRATPGLPEAGLQDFVSESDLVKYAKAEATVDSCSRALALGYVLVQSTSVSLAPADAPGPLLP